MNVQQKSFHFPYEDASLHEIREHLSPDRNTGLAAFSPHRDGSVEPDQCATSSTFGYHDRRSGSAAFPANQEHFMHMQRSVEPDQWSSMFGYHDRPSGSATFPANQELFMHMQRSVEPDQCATSSTFGNHDRRSGSAAFPANQEHFMHMQRSVEPKKVDKKKRSMKVDDKKKNTMKFDDGDKKAKIMKPDDKTKNTMELDDDDKKAKIMKPDDKKKNTRKFDDDDKNKMMKFDDDDDNQKKKIMKLDDDDDNKKKKIMKFDMFVPKGTFLFRLDDLGTSRSTLVWCVDNHRLIVRYDRVEEDRSIYARTCRYAGWLCLNPEKYVVLDKITLMEDGLVEIELPPVEALEQAYKHMIENQMKDNEELSGEESTSEVGKADGCEEVIVKDEEEESEVEVDAQGEIGEIQLETSANDEANETHEGASEGQLV